MKNVFSVEIFFIVFRETVEASIIISVILAFLKQGLGRQGVDKALYKRMVLQVWAGAAVGIFICLAVGGAFIGVFYTLGHDIWASAEDLWEGIFAIIATCMITVMGVAMLRINKMREKWRVKIAQALINTTNISHLPWYKKLDPSLWSRKYAMAVLPLVTTLREGVEAIVFVGGVSLGTPATAFPLAVICGLLCGCCVGYVIYRGGNMMSIQIFLIASTCFIYLIGAALFSRAVWYFQSYEFNRRAGGDVSEEGDGPGSYKITESVWHVNCCNPETQNGYMIFNAILGWQNSATYGSVISYNCYWVMVMVIFLLMMYQEKKGHFPLLSRIQSKFEKKMSDEERDELFRDANRIARQYHNENKDEIAVVEEGSSSSISEDIEKTTTQAHIKA